VADGIIAHHKLGRLIPSTDFAEKASFKRFGDLEEFAPELLELGFVLDNPATKCIFIGTQPLHPSLCAVKSD
jgi:hypothetical protein